MTGANSPTLREQVEDFLFKEAALLDDWRLDDWDFKIAHRRAVLDLEALSWHGAVSIIF